MAAGARATAAQPAFVLHQWDWRETSLVLDLFTRQQGRVAVVAKGAKRPYSQLRAVLLPFQCVAVQLTRPKATAPADGGDEALLTLRSAEYAGRGAMLPRAQLMTAFYLNELLQKLLPRNDPHERLFDAYADALQALAAPPAGDDGMAADTAERDEATLRAFELQLLRESGVLPQLDQLTVSPAPLAPDGRYRLDAELGLLNAGGTDGTGSGGGPMLSGSQCLALHAALQAGQGAALRAATGAALPALKLQLRALLAYHLGSPQLRTRQVMLQVRRLLDAPVA